MCATSAPAFSPQSKAELKSAVGACLKLSPKGDCSRGLYGSIGQWDVSKLTDMSWLFYEKASFNNDVSEWEDMLNLSLGELKSDFR